MNLYNSRITRDILSNLQKEDKIIITQINGKSISSTEFYDNIINVAKNLDEFGVKTTDVVAIFLRDSILFSNIIISSILCGLQVILLDPSMGRSLLIEKIQTAEVTHIFIEGFLYDYLFLTRLGILESDIVFVIHGLSLFAGRKKKLKELCNKNGREIHFIDADEDSECITVFTGGTTGNPKGVVHSLGSIYEMLKKIKYFLNDTKIFYADMPHFLLLGLLTQSHIISGPDNIKPKRLKDILEKFQIDTYFCPPYKYNYFIERNIKIPKTLTNILLGSAPIYTGFLKKLVPLLNENQKVTCIYGMTEILPIASIDGREKIIINIQGDVLGDFIESIDYKIINNELLVRGPHKMNYYLGYETKEYIETGDLVHIQNNQLVMIGRKKDMIIRKEFNIYPSLYESIISQIPGIISCAMVGIYTDTINDEKVILYIESHTLHSLQDKKNIFQLLKTGKYSIDSYALPDEITFMKLPTLGRQKKVDKEKLRNYNL